MLIQLFPHQITTGKIRNRAHKDEETARRYLNGSILRVCMMDDDSSSLQRLTVKGLVGAERSHMVEERRLTPTTVIYITPLRFELITCYL